MAAETLTEQELKLRVPDSDVFASILGVLGAPVETLCQTNIYFGPTDGSVDCGAMIRIRRSERGVELTIKDRAILSQGKQQVRERNQPLSLAELERVEAGEVGVTALANPLSEELSVQFGELCILGKSVNTRRVFPLIDGYIAEVDCTEFPSGRVDYEVEVELRQSAHTFASAARALSTALGSEIFAALEPSTSKYRRFLDTLS